MERIVVFVGPRAPAPFTHAQRKEGRTIHFATWLSKPFLILRAALHLYPPNLLLLIIHLPLGPLLLSKIYICINLLHLVCQQ